MWIEHLNAMDILREGIGLQGYGQRDPLVEYKAQAYNLFQRLMGEIDAQVVDILLKADIRPQPMTIERQPMRTMQMRGADESLAAGTFEGEKPVAPGGGAMPSEPVKSKNGVEVSVRTRSSAPEPSPTPTVSAFGKVGRNDPCPCGAKHPDGRPIKFKHCHGK
jgi:preprotein translocase subunit SecA